MLKAERKGIFWIFILFLIGILLFFGGLGVEITLVPYLGVSFGALLIILIAVLKRKIVVPPYFILYLIFLFFFLVSLKWSVARGVSLRYLALFTSGGLFWVTFYNLKKEFTGKLDKLIIGLGLLFAGLYLANNFFGDSNKVIPWSLYTEFSAYRNHNNIGDLWAVVTPILIFYLSKRPKNILLWLGMALGLYLLFISKSRAAYLAVVAVVGYLAYLLGLLEKYKKPLLVFTAIIILMFLVIGAQKSIFLSRPYYLQGVSGILRNPKGYGVGNFSVISEDPINHIFGLRGYSAAAHNIVLEILAGMGVFGLVFVFWLYKVLEDLWRDTGTKNIVYKVVFLTLTVNFFFHISYFIPTMLWLWFGSLGLSQSAANRR